MVPEDFLPPELQADPTYKKYYLKCVTKFVSKNVREDIGHGIIQQYNRKLVILIPEESDQRTRFLNAWMPDTIESYHEIVAEVGPPIHSPVKLSVHRGYDEKCDKPYLFVMSKGAEDILVRFKEGTVINITTLPANMESEGDLAPDAIEGNFQVVEQ